MNANNDSFSSEKIDRLINEYHEESERVTMAKMFVAAILAHVPIHSGMKCMEFGCGRGNLALLLPENLQITAIDPAAEAIDALTRKIAGMKVSNITPLASDIMDWQVPHTFDLIYSTLAMHHIKDIDVLLQKCNSALEASGYLILIDLDKEDGTFHDDNSQIHHFGFERELLQEKLQEQGFAIKSITEVYRREKERQDGQKRIYPLFMAIAEKNAGTQRQA